MPPPVRCELGGPPTCPPHSPYGPPTQAALRMGGLFLGKVDPLRIDATLSRRRLRAGKPRSSLSLMVVCPALSLSPEGGAFLRGAGRWCLHSAFVTVPMLRPRPMPRAGRLHVTTPLGLPPGGVSLCDVDARHVGATLSLRRLQPRKLRPLPFCGIRLAPLYPEGGAFLCRDVGGIEAPLTLST